MGKLELLYNKKQLRGIEVVKRFVIRFFGTTVAPHAGAWIETRYKQRADANVGRPSCGGVD
jgi:hypothetical protein